MDGWGDATSCFLEISLFLEGRGRLNVGYMICQANGENVISELDFLYSSENDLISIGSQIYFVDKLYQYGFKAYKLT